MPAELRVLPGLYWDRLTDAAKANFFADTWKVAPEADRMGYRFRGGRKIEFVERKQSFGAGSDPSNIVDSCYPYGSIQIPSGTEPIILHRDAVSGGGYFMVGTVISADMDLIGQLQPHTPTRFIEVSMDEALAARRSGPRCSISSDPRLTEHLPVSASELPMGASSKNSQDEYTGPQTGPVFSSLHNEAVTRSYLFNASFSALAGVKASFFAAATLMVAPVDGLRASRAGVSLTLNLPKPGIDVSAPEVAAPVMAAKTASTTALL